MEKHIVGKIVDKHYKSTVAKDVEIYQGMVRDRYCGACGKFFHGQIYQCRWGCRCGETCRRCAVVGVYHQTDTCMLSYCDTVGLDNQEQSFLEDHKIFHKILQKVSRQWWVYTDLRDWFKKDGDKDISYYFKV
jgi:hypothetical protein